MENIPLHIIYTLRISSNQTKQHGMNLKLRVYCQTDIILIIVYVLSLRGPQYLKMLVCTLRTVVDLLSKLLVLLTLLESAKYATHS